MSFTISTRAIALAISDALEKLIGHIEGIAYPLYVYGDPNAER